MKVTKTITKTYEIYDYIKWSMTAEDTIQKRKKVGLKTKGFDKCFCCNYKFESHEYPYLAFIKGKANVFVCEKCAEKIEMEK